MIARLPVVLAIGADWVTGVRCASPSGTVLYSHLDPEMYFAAKACSGRVTMSRARSRSAADTPGFRRTKVKATLRSP